MASPAHINGMLSPQMEPELVEDSDVEAELEVDQLDSDTDPEADTAKPKAAKNGSTTKPGERIPGHTLLPASRIENIIQADGVTGNMALSKEGLFVLSIATEEFIKRLIQAAHREASAHRRNQINYTDMATTAQQYQEFMILAETVPAPVTLADALILRQEKERELLEDNPALAIPYSLLPSTGPSPDPEPLPSLSKAQKRSRTSAANGKDKDKTNGSASTSSQAKTKKARKYGVEEEWVNNSERTAQWSTHAPGPNGHSEEFASNGNQRRSSRNGVPELSYPPPPPPMPNGYLAHLSQVQGAQYTPEGGYDLETIHSPPHEPDSRSRTPPYGAGGPSWPGQFTGPASGFLHTSVTPYVEPQQNTGRTIYSQANHPD